MSQMTIQVPDDLVEELRQYQARLREVLLLGVLQLKLHEALLLLGRGLVSLGRAAEMAGVTKDEMIRQARAANVVPRFSEEAASEELA